MEADPPSLSPETGTSAAARLVWGVRGFSCVFWGLPLGLALFFHAIEIRFVPWLRDMPPYLVGVLIVCTGAAMLTWARLPTPRWGAVTRQVLGAGVLLAYMGPFVFWYTRLPQVGPYYVVNMGVLLVSVIWLLANLNALAAEVGVLAGDLTFAAESRLSGYAVLALTALPLLAGLIASAILAYRYQSSLLGEFRGLSENIPFWIAMCLVIPLALTMSSSWKAKEYCLHMLRVKAGEN